MKRQTKFFGLLFIFAVVCMVNACSPTVQDKYFLKKADENIHQDTEDLMGKRPFSLF